MGAEPTDTAFSFRQAFSFGPFASKKKASAGKPPRAIFGVYLAEIVRDPPRVAVAQKRRQANIDCDIL